VPSLVHPRGHSGFSVFACVGERTSEVNQLHGEMHESGVLGQTSLVFGQMNKPTGAPTQRTPQELCRRFRTG